MKQVLLLALIFSTIAPIHADNRSNRNRPKALCMKHVGPYERFYESFTEAFAYMEQKGYKLAGHPRTSYIDGAWNQEDSEKWLSIIQIPIE